MSSILRWKALRESGEREEHKAMKKNVHARHLLWERWTDQNENAQNFKLLVAMQHLAAGEEIGKDLISEKQGPVVVSKHPTRTSLWLPAS